MPSLTNCRNSIDSRSNHRLDVQGLRAIAVILVVLFHSGLNVPGGFLGVDMFFVISGFVISETISREISVTGHFNPLQFMFRRVRRLFPALAAMLGFVIIFVMFYEASFSEQKNILQIAVSAIYSLSNWSFATNSASYFDVGNMFNPLLHTWSLGIEEQFYLIVPLAVTAGLWAHRKRLFNQKLLFLILLLVLLLSLSLQVYSSSVTREPISSLSLQMRLLRYIEDPFYGTPSRVWEFISGVMVSQFVLLKPISKIKHQRWVQILAIAIVSIISFTTRNQIPSGSISNMFIVLSTMGVLSVSTIEEQQHQIGRFLNIRLLVWIGDRSYGWYLWHWPFIVFATKSWPTVKYIGIVASVLSLAVASISYRFIELPWKSRRIKNPKRSIGLIFLSLGTLLGAALVLNSQRISETTSLSQYGNMAAWELPFGSCLILETNCLKFSKPTNNDILLVGDSHAASLSQVFVETTSVLGFNPQISTIKGCPFVRSDLIFYLYNFSPPNRMTDNPCIEAYDFDIAWIQKNKPKAVVISQYAPFYVNTPSLNSDFELRVACFERSQECENFPALKERLEYFERHLLETIAKIQSAGSIPILVAPLPTQHRDLDLGDIDPDVGTQRKVIDNQRSAILDLYSNIIQRNKSAIIWDPIGILCSDTKCPTSNGEYTFYADNGHLNITGANQLLQSLKNLLATLDLK